MSYNPDDHTDARRTAVALERIADKIEQFVEEALKPQAEFDPTCQVCRSGGHIVPPPHRMTGSHE